jgi:hypothetical protein
VYLNLTPTRFGDCAGGVQSQPELAALELMNKPVKDQTDQELLVTTMNRGYRARPKRVVCA